LERVSSEPVLARDLILRLSVRLRRIEDKIAGDLLPFAHDRSSDGAGETASDTVIADDATIWLAAQSDALRTRIGAAPIHVVKLPFLVGRVPVEGDAQPLRPDLLIEDEKPFRLSRQHFMIARSGDRLVVSDLGSTLGTMVNGWALGHHFMKDTEPLHRGENHVVAGGKDSPFKFSVFIS
jgi:CRP/FNR family cyclic AMP-dependent transcriptional regulator